MASKEIKNAAELAEITRDPMMVGRVIPTGTGIMQNFASPTVEMFYETATTAARAQAIARPGVELDTDLIRGPVHRMDRMISATIKAESTGRFKKRQDEGAPA